MIIQYMVSGEDSRTERTDYWSSVFLAEKTPFARACLGLSKMFLFVIPLSVGITLAISRL